MTQASEGQSCAPAQLLNLARSTREQALTRLEDIALEGQEPASYGGLDLSMLSDCEFDRELAGRAFDFCGSLLDSPSLSSACGGGAILRLAHNDLGSGTQCEQRIFELKAERELREREKAFFKKRKSDSSKEKDFASSAKMRNSGEQGIAAAETRLNAIDDELKELDEKKELTPWHAVFSCMEYQNNNPITHLDLADCGLHATSVVMLTQVVLDLEHRGGGAKVARLILDGNDLRDIAMAALASFLRLSGSLEALQLRNVGITDQGFSEIVAGLATNKTLALLDLRDNGLCTPNIAKEVVSGMRRFNATTEILY